MTEADRGESANRSLLADSAPFSQTQFSEESKSEARLAIVIATRNRAKSLLRTLYKLSPFSPPALKEGSEQKQEVTGGAEQSLDLLDEEIAPGYFPDDCKVYERS